MLRIRLFFAYQAMAFLALFKPENARQVLQDHINADNARLMKKVQTSLMSRVVKRYPAKAELKQEAK